MKTVCFIIWMLLSVILVLSVIGLVLFIPKDSYSQGENIPSTWYSIGKKLLNSVINE